MNYRKHFEKQTGIFRTNSDNEEDILEDICAERQYVIWLAKALAYVRGDYNKKFDPISYATTLRAVFFKKSGIAEDEIIDDIELLDTYCQLSACIENQIECACAPFDNSRAEYNRKYSKKWKAINIDKDHEYQKMYREKNKAKKNKYARDYRQITI